MPWSVESQLLRGVFTWISKYPPNLESLDRTTTGLGTEPSVSEGVVLWPNVGLVSGLGSVSAFRRLGAVSRGPPGDSLISWAIWVGLAIGPEAGYIRAGVVPDSEVPGPPPPCIGWGR